MRRLLLFGATALVLSLGMVSAQAISPNEQADLVALNQQAQVAFPGAALIEGRSAFIDDSGDQARAAESHGAGRAFREDVVVLMRDVILLGVASLVFGLGAVGVKALWVLDDAESWSHGWPRWPSH